MATWRQEEVVFKCLDVILGLIVSGKITATKEAVDITKALQKEIYREFGKPFDETK